jgi:hypothetical protein
MVKASVGVDFYIALLSDSVSFIIYDEKAQARMVSALIFIIVMY